MKRYKQGLERASRDNEDWFNRRYNEDATQRADAVRMLEMTDERIRTRNRQAAGSAAVTGGTEEGVAATKAANAAERADVASRIAADGEARRDAIEGQYLGEKRRLNDALNDLERQKAGAIAGAVQGVASAAGGMAGLF